MAWIPLAIAAVSAVTGAEQAKQARRSQQDAVEQENRRNQAVSAAQTQYSPWTGLGAQGVNMKAAQPGQSELGGAISGGIGGAMFGQQIAQGMSDRKTKAEAELEDEFNKMQTAGVQPSRGMMWSGNSRGQGGGTMNG